MIKDIFTIERVVLWFVGNETEKWIKGRQSRSPVVYQVLFNVYAKNPTEWPWENARGKHGRKNKETFIDDKTGKNTGKSTGKNQTKYRENNCRGRFNIKICIRKMKVMKVGERENFIIL